MRCFLAIELPEAVQQCLASLQERLAPIRRSVRWTHPEQIHLTIRFLGEVADGELPEICTAAAEAAKQCEPFDLTVSGTGCFPPGGAVRIIWTGIPGPPEPLMTCHQACEIAFAGLNVKREERAYHPHLTIGRVRTPGSAPGIRPAVAAQSGFEAGTFTVEELVLFESVLDRRGARYRILGRWPLNAASAHA